jgi:hypothetical protein
MKDGREKQAYGSLLKNNFVSQQSNTPSSIAGD